MTQDEIIEMAREAGLAHFYDSEDHCTGITDAKLITADKEKNDARLVEMLMPFANLVAAKEREACAKVVDEVVPFGLELRLQKATIEDCAAAIRARGASMTQEALKLALEVLISCELSNYGRDWVWPVTAHKQAMKDVKEAIATIKEALAQTQEPVSVYGYCPECGAKGVMRERRPNGNDKCANGHTYPSSTSTPPQRTWVGLTRDEQSFVYSNLHNATSREDSFWVDFANAIEAKLKELNT